MFEKVAFRPHPLASRSLVAEHLRNVLPGQNLYELAEQYSITVRKNGKLNKGWAGQTLERVAGLGAGNAQRRDGIDFELKSTSLVRNETGWKPKETIKITQLTPQAILEEQFEGSVLWEKLSSLILVGCFHDSPSRCTVVQVSTIDITDADLVSEIQKFWEEVRLTLCLGEMIHLPNQGTANDYIQLRPTGSGKNWSTCPITRERFPARAFYGTKKLITRILALP